jgi:hypothetical protein
MSCSSYEFSIKYRSFLGTGFLLLIFWSLPSSELFSIVWSEFLQAMTGDLQQDSLAPAQPREVGGGFFSKETILLWNEKT